LVLFTILHVRNYNHLFHFCAFTQLQSLHTNIPFLTSSHIRTSKSARSLLRSRSQSHIATDGQSVSKSWCRAPSRTDDQIYSYYYLTVTVLFLWGVHTDERTGLSFVYAAGSYQQSFSGPSPLVRATIFDCLRFETSHFVASYDSQGHGGGIRPRLHTGF
jgi:hypothetical protein